MSEIDKSVKSNVTQAIKTLNKHVKARSGMVTHHLRYLKDMLAQYEEYFGVKHPRHDYYSSITSYDLLYA